MSLIESLVSCTVFALTLSVSVSAGIPLARFYEKILRLEKNYSRDNFLYKSFCSFCGEEKETVLTKSVEWKKECMAEFCLDELSVKECEGGYLLSWKAEGESKNAFVSFSLSDGGSYEK